MTRIDRVKEILKEMTEEERLELIRLCNINDNQKIDDCFNKLSNNHHCPYCNSKDITSVIYLYRYNDNNTFVKKNNDEVKYSKRKRKPKNTFS